MFYSSFRLEAGIFFFYTLFSVYVQSQSQEWPVGTLATASSTRPSNKQDSYSPNNAIDNDPTTKWNDNTEEGDPSENPFPDIFTLSIGSVVNLDGIMLLSGGKVSGSDGWILDYTVETSLDGVTWNLSATVQRNNLVLRLIRFDDGPLNVKHLRVIITAAKDSFSRILELSPVYAVSNSSTNPLGASTTTPPPVSSKTKSNTMEIVASLLGGLAGILLGLLAYVLWLLRKQRNGGVGDPQKRPVGDFSFHKPVVSELGNHHPDSVTTYPRSELA